MPHTLTRRQFFAAGSAVCASATPTASLGLFGLRRQEGLHERFPAQDDEAVEAVVRFSHFSLERVQELVDARPALAKANWDWGYGDWESALGAAAHTGNVEIAEYLIERGARPTLYSATAMGQLDVVRAFVAASPGIQKQAGPHGIPLLAHAEHAGDRAREVAEYLESVGGAGVWPASEPYGAVRREAFVGIYRFGAGDSDYLEAYDRREALMLRRGEDTGRVLTHVGGDAFHPAGAPAVRIVFDVDDGVPVRVTVHDPDPVVTALREG
jgi:hypothetical protein